MGRTVYIGNGEEITVTSAPKMKVLDVNKALDLYLENINKEVYITMQTDSFFTASKVKSVLDIEDYHLQASDWDTPGLEIDDKFIPCFIEVDNYAYSRSFYNGYLRGYHQNDIWFPKLNDTVKQLEYEEIVAMKDAINAIVESYQDKRSSKGMRDLTLPRTKKGKEIQGKLTPTPNESDKV